MPKAPHSSLLHNGKKWMQKSASQPIWLVKPFQFYSPDSLCASALSRFYNSPCFKCSYGFIMPKKKMIKFQFVEILPLGVWIEKLLSKNDFNFCSFVYVAQVFYSTNKFINFKFGTCAINRQTNCFQRMQLHCIHTGKCDLNSYKIR